MNYFTDYSEWGMYDEYDSEYDSTWEEDDPTKIYPPKTKKHKKHHQYTSRYRRAMMDMQNYRHGYRDNQYFTEDLDYMPNLEFYLNNINFEPSGVTIDELIDDWKDDYERLECNHCYIQWLFPLRERGVNPHASPLTLGEIQAMKEDTHVRKRLLESYKLMLGFYGIILQNDETGKVTRAENWKERFKNLNNHCHNNLRITRILKSLGELGYEHFQAPLVRFFLEETLLNNQLKSVKSSVLDYFMFTVKNKEERRKLVHYAWENYKEKNKFKWGPLEELRKYTPDKDEVKQTIGAEDSQDKNTHDVKDDSLDNSVTNDAGSVTIGLGLTKGSKHHNSLGEKNGENERNHDIQSERKNEEYKDEETENMCQGKADGESERNTEKKEPAGLDTCNNKDQPMCNRNDRETEVMKSMECEASKHYKPLGEKNKRNHGIHSQHKNEEDKDEETENMCQGKADGESERNTEKKEPAGLDTCNTKDQPMCNRNDRETEVMKSMECEASKHYKPLGEKNKRNHGIQSQHKNEEDKDEETENMCQGKADGESERNTEKKEPAGSETSPIPMGCAKVVESDEVQHAVENRDESYASENNDGGRHGSSEASKNLPMREKNENGNNYKEIANEHRATEADPQEKDTLLTSTETESNSSWSALCSIISGVCCFPCTFFSSLSVRTSSSV